MQILNIGPLELVAILILALLIMGPKDLVKTGAQLGSFVRKVVKSPVWRSVMSTSQEIRELPKKIIQESGIDSEIKEFEEISKELQSETKKIQSISKIEVEDIQIDPVSISTDPPDEREEKETRF